MEKLERICQFFHDNHITAICEAALVKRAYTLNLSHYELTELPEVLAKCDILLKLFLNNNHLISISNIIGNLRNLCVLTLDYNKLTEFPLAICQLTTLKVLNISCNEIHKLPAEIGQLIHLETFWCNNTGLLQIPNEIGDCKCLETFGARGNHLTTLPYDMKNLTKLRWLTLESNELTTIPEGFTELQQLVHINLKNNRLTRIPDCLSKMRKLQFVFLNNNCIEESCPMEQLNNMDFIRMLNVRENPFCQLALVRDQLSSYPYVLYELTDNISTGSIFGYISNGNVLDAEDEEGDLSDWENSIETSDLNSTDDSSFGNDLEDISQFLPELSRYITNFN